MILKSKLWTFDLPANLIRRGPVLADDDRVIVSEIECLRVRLGTEPATGRPACIITAESIA